MTARLKRHDVATTDLARDYLAGATVTDLAMRYRVRRTTIFARLRSAGVQMRHAGRRCDAERYWRVVDMRARGLSFRAIMRALGLKSPSQVAKILATKFLPLRPAVAAPRRSTRASTTSTAAGAGADPAAHHHTEDRPDAP